MNRVRSFLSFAVALLVLAAGGCTLDTKQPSGWQGGGGWDNFRA
jgi:hypothetical protein